MGVHLLLRCSFFFVFLGKRFLELRIQIIDVRLLPDIISIHFSHSQSLKFFYFFVSNLLNSSSLNIFFYALQQIVACEWILMALERCLGIIKRLIGSLRFMLK
jgi:hypothetical protein